jgi:hypothetical protein
MMSAVTSWMNTKAKAAPSVRKTIFDYENSTKGRGTEDFTALAVELIDRLEVAQSQKKVVNASPQTR